MLRNTHSNEMPRLFQSALALLLLILFLPITSWAQDGSLKWAFPTWDLTSSPAIAGDGTIYIPTFNGRLYAVSRYGTFKWMYNTYDTVWFDSSPAIGADGTVYLGTLDGQLVALTPYGTRKWSYYTLYYISQTPAIGADGTIYVGGGSGELHAVNPDGTAKWLFQVDNWAWIDSSPVIGVDGTVYVGTGGDTKVYAINPDGTLKWTFQVADNLNNPAIGADGTIYVGSWDRNLYAVNPDGTQKWVFQTGDTIYSSPAIGVDGTIYIGSGDTNLYAINPDGTLKWASATGGHFGGTPAIGADGTIYVAAGESLFALNPDGTKRWDLGCLCLDSSPAIGSDGTIYIGAAEGYGYLYAINSTSGGLARSAWPMFQHDARHSGRARIPSWQVVYDQLFDRPSDLELLRQYRDKVLSRTIKGRIYTYLLYKNSREALSVLVENPELMIKARLLIEANRDAVAKTVSGDETPIRKTENVLPFLEEYASKSPLMLKILVYAVIADMLHNKEEGEEFAGFRLE